MKYEKLLSPIKINNVVLKNRMIASNSLPHFLQGPEEYPSESIIRHLAGIAQNGASIVTFADWSDKSLRSFSNGDICRFPVYDLDNPATANYMNQLADAVHFYGAKLSLALSPKTPQGVGVYTNKNPELPDMFKEMLEDAEDMPKGMEKLLSNDFGQKMFMKMMSKPRKDAPPFPIPLGPTKAITESQMQEMINDVLRKCEYYKSCGFDMVTLHMAYRSTLLANFLSPLTNKRTDEYGGSMENRSRFPLMMCKAIKEKFGKDFLIEVQISGEDGIEGGNTIDDIIEFAKLSEGLIDIMQIRAGNADDAHPTGFNSKEDEPLTIKYAEAIKRSGAKIIVEPIGGYQDPDQMEKFLKEDKADMFGMARSWICDFEYGNKIYDGRSEDIVPCIRCNKCHGVHMNGPWRTVCSVNPKMGLQTRLNFLETIPNKNMNIAIIGGGPAGLYAAIEAFDKGYSVTLYEKNSILGGALLHSDYSSFKWPLKNYKDYLVRQVEKRNIKVLLNTEATPELLKDKKYDAILMALGTESVIPDIDGIKNENGNLKENIYTVKNIFGNTDKLGKKVVVVGGEDSGIETALYLAETGHKVDVISSTLQPAPSSNRVHYYSMLKKYIKNNHNLNFVGKAKVIKYDNKIVTYIDKDGQQRNTSADSIVLCCGLKSLKDKALAFSGISSRFYIIGDNEKVGSVESSTRSAYGIVNAICPKYNNSEKSLVLGKE